MWIGVPRRRSSTRECSSGVLFFQTLFFASLASKFSFPSFGGAISPARFHQSSPRTRAKTRSSAPLVVSYSQQRSARAKNPLRAETRRATSMSARETPTARMGATTSMNIITLEAIDEDSAVRASTPLSALCRAVPFRRSRELSASFLLHAHFRSLPTGPRRRSPDLPSPAPNSRPTRALS